MTWLPVIALAALAFLAAAVVLRLPRGGYALLGAALLFGLAGYALQGSPGQPAAPGRGERAATGSGEALVAARREFFDPARLPSRFMITSDAFARRGDYARAAAFAHTAIAEDPGDAEAWTALGNALVEHAGGRLTPAAVLAYRQAARREPGASASSYFLGLATLRAGEPERTRELWRAALAQAPADAPWRAGLAERLTLLETLMARVRAQAPPPAPAP